MDPIVLTLRAVQNAANNQNPPSEAPLTWDALNRAAQSYGAPDIDYERFAKLFDSDPTIQSIVDNFDEQGVTLKTDKAAEHPAQGNLQPAQNHNMMAAAAKHATTLGK